MDVVKKVNVLKARQNLGQLLEEVYYRGDQYIIERAGKPMAAMVPISHLEERQKHRERLWAVVEAVWACTKDVPPDRILLSLGEYQGITILTPRAFLEVLQS
jgi:prevent-host-death family protein